MQDFPVRVLKCCCNGMETVDRDSIAGATAFSLTPFYVLPPAFAVFVA
jgi:hypothetical protein